MDGGGGSGGMPLVVVGVISLVSCGNYEMINTWNILFITSRRISRVYLEASQNQRILLMKQT